MSEVEPYRPLPEKRSPRGDRPPRVVVLYLDESGGRMAGFEWTRPEVVLEYENEDLDWGWPTSALPSASGTKYTLTITGYEYRGIMKDA